MNYLVEEQAVITQKCAKPAKRYLFDSKIGNKYAGYGSILYKLLPLPASYITFALQRSHTRLQLRFGL